jgi:predicted Zn-dependent peptidase
VVSVSGNIKHRKVIALIESALARDGFLDRVSAPEIRKSTPYTRSKGSVGLLARKSEQAHLFFGLPSVDRDDPRRFAVGVLSAALGGGMSSRLFQEVREKRGLAYSVYSYAQQFSGTGHLGFYAGTAPKNAKEVIKVFRGVLEEVAGNGLSSEELLRAKGAVRGSLVLSQEDSGSRMSRIGKSELVYGHVASFDEILRRIDSVDTGAITAIAGELLGKSPTLAVVGPFRSATVFENLM